MIHPVAFYVLAAVLLTAVVAMILQKNPITSVMCLIAAFLALSGLYLQLGAHFVATMQILVYAGAIMVLFVFVIMLLNLKDHELTSDRLHMGRILVWILGLACFAIFVFVFLKIPPLHFAVLPVNFGTVEDIGAVLFRDYIVAFELIGILLLVGLVGAILLGKREE